MSHVTMVRHGQANSSAQDEASYDKLSDLGWQQARWLGVHFRDSGEAFARVYSGTLRRHRETAEGIDVQALQHVIEDPRLNELEYFTMSTLLQDQHGVPFPGDAIAFSRHMPVLFQHWQDNKIEGVPEPFADFQARVDDVLFDIAAGQGRALVVTSGGVIGMAMRVTMGLDIQAMAHSCLAIMNTSLHRWQPMPTGLACTQFNAIPHLEWPDRHLARTHV